MAIKKSDIYRSLWESCDQLRGGMDASLYKDYILTLLFVKYVSDRAGQADALIEVPPGASFSDMKKLRGSKDIGEGMDMIIARIAEENDLSGVIDRAFFNDAEKFGRGQKMISTLTALINIFSREELNFSNNRADGDDIRNHPDFSAFRAQVSTILDGWVAANTPLLTSIKQGDHPRDLIHTIAEDMLSRFDAAPLVDKYEAYQRLMSYWATTMQDDVFIIAGGGWLAARDLREARKETSDDGKVKWLEEGDLTVNRVRLVADVIPPALVTARFFVDLKAALDQATARVEELGREIEELAEEHGAEGGLFEELMADGARLTAGGVKTRLKDKTIEPDEKALLKQAARLFEGEAKAKRAAKEAEAKLTEAVLKKYPRPR